jgi:acyl-[acyl-carrier-protein] desaturase
MTEFTMDLDKDRVLVDELAAPAGELFDRHLAASKDWYPFEDVPFDVASDITAEERWNAEHYPLSDGVKSAIVVNVLTEDNLPYYTHTLLSPFAREHPLSEWTRRWTAEEWRHSAAIRDWILATRAVDPYQLERDRMAQMTGGEVPTHNTVAETIAYVSFQELATQVAHRNTGQSLGKHLRGRKIMAKVAGDEGLHHAFYRDLVAASLKIDPTTMLVAIQRQLRAFKMPGTGIPRFAEHQLAIAKAGIFGPQQFTDQVVTPTLDAWGIFSLEGLGAVGERARDKIARNLAGLKRLAAAHERQLAAVPG